MISAKDYRQKYPLYAQAIDRIITNCQELPNEEACLNQQIVSFLEAEMAVPFQTIFSTSWHSPEWADAIDRRMCLHVLATQAVKDRGYPEDVVFRKIMQYFPSA